MSKDLQRLKSLGAQKIHEDTHIALRYVQSVLHENFEELSKVQFLGFISILEREYQLNLSDLKTKGMNYFEEEDSSTPKVFVLPEKKRSFAGLYILIVLIIFALAIYESFNYKQASTSLKTLDNHTILDAQKKIVTNKKVTVLDQNKSDENLTKLPPQVDTIEESNTSIETDSATKIIEKKEPVIAKPISTPVTKKTIVKKSFSIVIKPRKKVWIGYINRTDKIKHQGIVRNYLNLDASKEWLIVTGHGNINIVLNGKTKRFSSPKTTRYLYKNGSLKKLNAKEFRKLNNGHLW